MSAADEKKKATPVGVANVERRTWNEQEYEEKAAQRDEEVRFFLQVGRRRRQKKKKNDDDDDDDDRKNSPLFQLFYKNSLSTGCARRGGVQGRGPQAQEDR